MDEAKHWLVGLHFDLFEAEKQDIATRGLRDGILSKADLQALCSAVLDHAERHRCVMKIVAKSAH